MIEGLFSVFLCFFDSSVARNHFSINTRVPVLCAEELFFCLVLTAYRLQHFVLASTEEKKKKETALNYSPSGGKKSQHVHKFIVMGG